MTSDWREWDFDELHRRRPRIEVLPPEPRVRITIERRRSNFAAAAHHRRGRILRDALWNWSVGDGGGVARAVAAPLTHTR